ncbi:hypothetical protein ACFO5X_21370 [Seohaeicola nanhaiensis]|uniref:Uncharacterized protein n=1 Tax=Seohaeicola nanhaiensis TaxID=1387282 RepID=A0ABV9KMR8_9RHOB
MFDRLEIDPRYHRTLDEIVYLEDIKWLTFDPEVIDNISELVSGLFLMHNRAKRIAIVADSEPGRSIARRFIRVMSRNPDIRVALFGEPLAALHFLGQTDPRLLEKSAPRLAETQRLL